jgi:VWFA-related protein
MRVRTISAGVVLIASTALLAPGRSDQRPGDTPQFRAGVELIQLDVAVLDNKREPVRGLTASDFTVLDNGVESPIRAFTPIELATRTRTTDAVWAQEAAPDVVTNRVGEQDGRLVIILMDRSIPMAQPTIVARRIATAAVDALGPNDLAAVVSTSNGAVQNLTADRARLLRAINTGDPSTGMSAEAKQIMELFTPVDPLSDGRCLCGLCVLETITRVAEAVQDTPRRRKILFFIGSDMIWQSTRSVMAAGADVGCETRIKDARTLMFKAIDRANLTVHSVDPQGLVTTGPQTKASTPGGFDRPVRSGPAVRLEQQQAATNTAMTSRQNLEVLPSRTGGRTVVGQNHPEEVVPAVFRESESYYVLGIERGTSDRPNTGRSLEVKVGRKGLRVYTQRQYVGLASATEASARSASASDSSSREALSRLLPSASVPLALAVTPFASPGSASSIVRVNIDAGAFARKDGTPVPLDITVVATDQAGRGVASARQTSTISGSRETPGVVAGKEPAPEINVQSHVELAPGDYSLRVAVSDTATGRLASVFSDVAVPKFDGAALSLSGVTVDIASSPSVAPVATTRRLFRRDEIVRALLQIYQGTQRTDAIVPVSMRVQILDAKGSAVRDQSLPFGEQTFTNRRADCVITLPLATLPAGDYLLRLEASVGGQRTGRALRFAVE